MNIFQEISAFFKVKSAAEEIIKEIKMPTVSGKPGWKTTEFWFTAASQLATLFAAVKGFIPADIASKISIVGVAVYTIAATIRKAVSDVQTTKQTTATIATTAPVTTVSTPA
jgi:nucleoside-triphosphatase THEP1